MADNTILFVRYGGISIGGKLPVLHVSGDEVVNFFSDLCRMMNVTGVSKIFSSLYWRIVTKLKTCSTGILPGSWSLYFSFLFKGQTSLDAAKEFSNFLKYMETEDNVKVFDGNCLKIYLECVLR